MLPTIAWRQGRVVMIDQTKLPFEEVYVECLNHEQVAEAIETMVIRGAPAIGVAAAFGVVLGVQNIKSEKAVDEEFTRITNRLQRTRPTARNLFWALERMKAAYERNRSRGLEKLRQALLEHALAMDEEDVAACKSIGYWGKELIKPGDTILTHCNAGALATSGYGTALGVVRAAYEEYRDIKVYVDETRPFLQGARLTCWELSQERIPAVLITDNMAGYLMSKGEVSVVVTGADRIVRNGDTANKIGTYSLAVLAWENKIPFYIAAPMNTIDFDLADGSQIPIEERKPDEIRTICGKTVTLPEIEVRNPAFDVTPARYIAGIITEKGIARPLFEQSLPELRGKEG